MQSIRGNVPLAAGYLKLFALKRGLGEVFAIDIVPPALANGLGDRGLVEEILARNPEVVGFTCYVWNIERTLWIASQLKQIRPELRTVLGGPEITHDNAWVLAHPAVDHAAIGEGEQTFADLLHALKSRPAAGDGEGLDSRFGSIRGLWTRGVDRMPQARAPLRNLDEVSSPYLEGILDAADEQTLFLETVRGCAFRCKFCYYPKSYDAVYYVSAEKIAANLRHAAERGAKEIVLLDPTLNQRRDFDDFLRLLARHNPHHRWTCFGELRAEGIDAERARLLRQAGFTEVEVGLQSLDPRAQELMDRKVNLKAFERGAKAMLDEGLTVRVDLIVGLPGDTPDSVRRSIEYLHQNKLYTAVQVFNLSVLPGTAFRHEARQLGLEFQARPPYYVLQTPTLSLEQLYELMEEAQEAFELEFDPFPPPELAPHGAPAAATSGSKDGSMETSRRIAVDRAVPVSACIVDLDAEAQELPPPGRRAQAFTLHIRAADFDQQCQIAARIIRGVLDDNPHTSLEIVLEPTGEPKRLTERTLSTLLEACFAGTSYLDWYYSLHPNRLLGAKRLIVLLSQEKWDAVGEGGLDQIAQYATIATCQGTAGHA